MRTLPLKLSANDEYMYASRTVRELIRRVKIALRVEVTPKFKYFYKNFKNKEFNLLDVGCGNHSASKTKSIFSKCRYYGVDQYVYNNDDEDFDKMERYFELDLSTDNLSVIPDDHFEVVILSHVIEHLENGLTVIESLAAKLKIGGLIYIEFPSLRSLSLPSMPGTLNFWDDKSHMRPYQLQEVVNTLLACSFTILRAGRRRNLPRAILTPLVFIVFRVFMNRSYATAFWDLLGFANFVFAEKRPLAKIS
ncbi:class I SAM-dependent methyltransferase [bacterium]|nr:class I SAM-dependent methyltransferase [bacterium]